MKVSFAIVAYNEEKTLPRLLDDLRAQDYPREKIEVLLIDSLSTDGTRRIMESFAAEDNGFARVLVLDNPGKTLPYGCNVALENYTGDAIVRIDGHASIPPEFLRKNTEVLEGGERVSGGSRPNIIDEETPWKRTLLSAESSMFGGGAAGYRSGRKRQYVSSVFHGMYCREVYDAVGLYDVRLARTEDNDMSWRIRQAGYRLCYDPDIVSWQHTRPTLRAMLRQKYLNGFWIGRTMGVNPRCFSLFHFVPLCFVLGILLTTALALCGLPLIAALMWAAYALCVLAFAVADWVTDRPFVPAKLLLPVLFLLLHLSYGAGTLAGLVDMPLWLWKQRSQNTV